MRILGLDPGLAKSGFGFINYVNGGSSEILYGDISTSKDEVISQRLWKIYSEVKEIVQKTNPDAVVIEDIFFCKNVKTAISVAQSRGVMILASAQLNCPVFEYTPLQIKQSVVGYGHATKMQVQQMVKTLLNLKEIPKPDHAADALAAALCHAHSLKFSKLLANKK